MKPLECTIGSLLKRTAVLGAVSDSPRLDVELLLAHVMGKTRTYLYTWPQCALSDDQVGQLV